MKFNHFVKVVFSLFFCTSFVFISCSQVNKTSTEFNKNVTYKEDFNLFLSNFSSDTIYQKERITKNFLECEVTIEGDSTCYKESISKWIPVKLIENDVLSKVYNNFLLHFEDTDERVFSFEKIESGAATYYYFRREKSGKWFLVKRVVYLD
jgi:hypothetical protein